MSRGFEGHASVDGSICLCTGSGLSRNRNILESSSGFGGTNWGIPRTYDFDRWEGQVSFEGSDGVIGSILGMIGSKVGKTTLSASINSGSTFTISDACWSAVSLSASEGSLVSGSCSVVGVSGDYSFASGGWKGSSGYDLKPIAYWQTGVGGYTAVSWSFNVTQDVVIMGSCSDSGNPTPFAFGLGPTRGTVSVEFVRGGTIMESGSISITTGAGGVSFPVELASTTGSVSTGDGVGAGSVEYNIFG